MSADRPFLATMLMLGFCLLAPMGDAIAKFLGGSVPLITLLTARFGVQALILVPISWPKMGDPGLRTMFGLMALRTLLHIIGIGLMFTSLRYLPLADALAIAFVMPFILLALGHILLGEHVGAPRIWACVVGFAGTLLVIQPNFIAIGAPALLPFGVALVFALFVLVTRRLARLVDPITLQAISGLQALAMLLPILLIWPDPLADVGPPEWGLLLAMGLFGTLAHLCMSWSLRFAPAATLAPMQYLEIPFGTLIGWVVFADLPNRTATTGIVMTIGAGLYIIWRERQLASRLAEPPGAA